ncbi:MAG: DUF1553 domain-containing protein [Planctomycetota bacterium]|nr:DUF1553 domain-containing protein [Planctomycetota bacterium]
MRIFIQGLFVSLVLVASTFSVGSSEEEDRLESRRWCDLPLTSIETPQLQGLKNRAESQIDHFWLSGLEKLGIEPAPEADPVTLLRRLHYALTGLPPTPAEIDSYLQDNASDRWQRRVDQLLADPQFGVHWARHWLDLVRWAETDSYERDRLKPGAWRYRDWVVNAFNSDMPYDQFVTLQLAGDELDEESLDHHVATGFLHLGIRDDEPADPLQAVFDDLDGMLDTTCRSMLGISMGCARCHDHKGDPIPARDYYRMLSFFEGLKHYKVGGGNHVNTDNFVRKLPVDLGTDEFEDSLEDWRRERNERLLEVRNLIQEVKERWGEETLQQARADLWQGQVIHLGFNQEHEAIIEDRESEREEGRHGQALKLAENDRLLIERPVQDDFSISLWFRTEHEGAGGNDDLRWFRGTGLVDGEIGGVVADFGISLVGQHVCAGVGQPETFIHGPDGMADGQWHHVVFTRKREDGRIVLWVDGAQVASANGGKQQLKAPEHLSIGRMYPDRHTLHGNIDEIRFWDRVLENHEVIDLNIGGGALPAHRQMVKERLGEAEADRLSRAVERLSQLQRPNRQLVQVLSAQEQPNPPTSHVRIRGTASSPGDEVQAGFPEILGGGDAVITKPQDGESSGRRLALARWITDPGNPRTARVISNRIWQHLFGHPIVPTPNDFGELGLPPHDPELLDRVALELIDEKWSLKGLIRRLVTSSVFKVSNQYDAVAEQKDPGNRYLWRFRGRRLSAEELRDSVLAISGNLNRTLAGPGVYPPMPQEILATSSRPGAAWGRSNPEESARRSLFIHVKRSLLHPMLLAFDMADTDSSCPVRFNTVQPTQALTLLNSDFTIKQGKIFAERLRGEADSLATRVERALYLVAQRKPTSERIRDNIAFIENIQQEHNLDANTALDIFCVMAFNLNEFIHID